MIAFDIKNVTKSRNARDKLYNRKCPILKKNREWTQNLLGNKRSGKSRLDFFTTQHFIQAEIFILVGK